MRSMWSGSIGFGMVHVPVKLYTAVREQEPKFKRYHSKSKSYPRQVQMVDDEVVPMIDLCSVYETPNGLVEFTKDELSSLKPASAHHMQVQEFVPMDSIDPLYVEKTYFLGPERNAETAFTLLGKSLDALKRAAIVNVTLKTKEHLAAIYVNRGVLSLSTLYYEAEVVADNAIYHDQEDVSDEALDLARQYIEAMSSDCFDPSMYRDASFDRLMALIRAKENGLVISTPDELVRKAAPADMLAVLRRQIEERKVAA